MMDVSLPTWLLFNGAARHHHRTEVVSRTPSGEIHRYTLGEFASRAQQLMWPQDEVGIGAGDRVATLAWNGYRPGRVLHTINVRLSVEEVAFVINDADDRVVLVDPDFLPLLENVLPLEPGVLRARFSG